MLARKPPMPLRLKLRFPVQQVRTWAARYDAEVDDEAVRAGSAARDRGHLTADELRALAWWKTPRSASRIARNEAELVRETTRVALQSPSERLRIEVLTLLDGVDWPTASVVLHFAHRDPYPILDRRALWSVGLLKVPRYDFELWERYVALTRATARSLRASMRDVDRALWQYAKERQR
jgi:hypothetical protein